MNLRLISTASILLGASLSLAIGQDRPGRPGGDRRPDPAEMIKGLSERYSKLATYDTDKNGKLDDTEQAAVAKAIEDGSLKAGPPGRDGAGAPPKGEGPAPKEIASHMAEMYAEIAAYDTDKNGTLSETEQTAVQTAIKEGKVKLPHRGGRGPGGPGGPGGRGGRGPGGPEGAPPPPPGE